LPANVYLQYVLDLWFERRLRKGCTGAGRLIRYADDFVVCSQKETDARRFRTELVERLAQFDLTAKRFPLPTPRIMVTLF